jgi:hypothetical protein
MNLKEYFLSNKSGSFLKEKYLEKHNNKLYNDIKNYGIINGLNVTFKELVWLYINSVTEKPKCKICDNETKFDRLSSGYRVYCSKFCKSNDIDIKNKTKNTFIEKYGGHPINNEKIKEKIKKTNLERYGNENILKSDIIKKKIESTNMEKYGVKRPLESNNILEKTKKVMLERYGVEHGLQSKNIHEKTIDSLIRNNDWEVIINKIKETKYERHYNENYNNVEKQKETLKERYNVDNPNKVKEFIEKRVHSKFINSVNKYKHSDKIIINGLDKNDCVITCKECEQEVVINRHFLTMRGNNGKIICTNCNPLNSSKSSYESEIIEFLEKNNIEYIKNDRKLLNGLEVDIIIPSSKLCIEMNGLYWHNELYCDKKYHLNKTDLCNIKGYELLHIFEDEWLFKKEIVLSIIKNRLKIIDNVIFSRKCNIKEISPKEEKEFLNNNHIQGYVPSKIKLGLFYENELVSLMTFGGLRKSLGSKSEDNTWEMLRFCNKINTSVVGSASKLFKYFLIKYNPKKIVSYSDNRLFTGKLYEKLCFNFITNTQPNYYYVKGLDRYHRFKYRKDVLVKQGYDPNKTEHQIMLERGVYRIYDCGNKKWEYDNTII